MVNASEDETDIYAESETESESTPEGETAFNAEPETETLDTSETEESTEIEEPGDEAASEPSEEVSVLSTGEALEEAAKSSCAHSQGSDLSMWLGGLLLVLARTRKKKISHIYQK